MRIFKKLGWFFKKEKWSYIWGIIALLIIAICNLLPPKLMGDIIDGITEETLTVNTLIFLLGGILINAIIVYVLRYVWRVCIFGASYRLERIMRFDLFKHFTKMSSSFFQEHRVGDLMAHATNDLKAVQRVAGFGVLQFADALITGISVVLAMAFTISWKLTIITLLPLPLMVIGSQYLSKKLHITFEKAQEAFSDMNNRTHETVSGIKVTKTFGQEKEEIEVFKKEIEDVYEKNLAVTKYDAAFDPLITIIIMFCMVLVFYIGSLFIRDNYLTIGQLVAFINYVHLLVWPMLAFGFLYNTIERGNVSYERIEALMNIQPDIVDSKTTIMDVPKGQIEIKINHFQYPNTDVDALNDINVTLQKGQTLGLVGKTGAGKTTLIKLLLREYDVTQGQILLDQTDIKQYQTTNLHKSIGYVPQDQFLFSTTILDNIRFGDIKADKQRVEEAAKVAAVHEDILGFSEQYNTLIGERGVSLSGGQKQRLAIARALVLDPTILIMDDALSAVDARTEEAILSSLKENRKDKTTVIAAHRLSAVKHADVILVFDQGQIIERGTHQELLAKQGWYADIYAKQEISREVENRG